MWNVQHITTGLSLVAFLGVIILFGYRANLKHRLKIIETVPRQQRAAIITKELNMFGVDAKNLSREQQYNLAKAELDGRMRKYLISAFVFIVAMLIFGATAAFSIIYASPKNIESRLDRIQNILENKDNSPQQLNSFVNQQGFEKRYPLGYALFYSDGRKTLHYGWQSPGGISFDASKIHIVKFGKNYLCISADMDFSPNITGIHFGNACFQTNGPEIGWIGVNDASIKVEPLAGAAEGAAWIVGMKPN